MSSIEMDSNPHVLAEARATIDTLRTNLESERRERTQIEVANVQLEQIRRKLLAEIRSLQCQLDIVCGHPLTQVAPEPICNEGHV